MLSHWSGSMLTKHRSTSSNRSHTLSQPTDSLTFENTFPSQYHWLVYCRGIRAFSNEPSKWHEELDKIDYQYWIPTKTSVVFGVVLTFSNRAYACIQTFVSQDQSVSLKFDDFKFTRIFSFRKEEAYFWTIDTKTERSTLSNNEMRECITGSNYKSLDTTLFPNPLHNLN